MSTLTTINTLIAELQRIATDVGGNTPVFIDEEQLGGLGAIYPHITADDSYGGYTARLSTHRIFDNDDDVSGAVLDHDHQH